MWILIGVVSSGQALPMSAQKVKEIELLLNLQRGISAKLKLLTWEKVVSIRQIVSSLNLKHFQMWRQQELMPVHEDSSYSSDVPCCLRPGKQENSVTMTFGIVSPGLTGLQVCRCGFHILSFLGSIMQSSHVWDYYQIIKFYYENKTKKKCPGLAIFAESVYSPRMQVPKRPLWRGKKWLPLSRKHNINSIPIALFVGLDPCSIKNFTNHFF